MTSEPVKGAAMVASPIDWSHARRMVVAVAAGIMLNGCLGDATEVAEPTPAESLEGTGFTSPPVIDPDDTQTPRPPDDTGPVILTPGPPIGGNDTHFDDVNTSSCIELLMTAGPEGTFDEDATIIAVSVGPDGTFDEADVCGGVTQLPPCEGVTIPAGNVEPACAVGVTWDPNPDRVTGWIELSFSATCNTGSGYCAEVPSGTPVRFSSAIDLTAEFFGTVPDEDNGEIDDPEDDDPEDADPDNGQPDDDVGGESGDGTPDEDE